ncbi:hypothetical protein LCGC14_0374120 [marine sediment metagenome]|uniref:Uncharacterized protein n=1 Tax=marine sediment metagenome TaxID=412755 RepID=A0A0F9TM72_9ZZZZ
MSEPLKNKRIPFTDLRNYNDGFGFYSGDIKSAVEWLKYKDRGAIGNIGLFLGQFTRKEISFKELETLITIELEYIDMNRNKAFEDVTQGDKE